VFGGVVSFAADEEMCRCGRVMLLLLVSSAMGSCINVTYVDERFYASMGRQ